MFHVVIAFLVLQALADAEPGVIAEAVRFLTAVCRERQIRKPSLLAAARKVSGAVANLLCLTFISLHFLIACQSSRNSVVWRRLLSSCGGMHF